MVKVRGRDRGFAPAAGLEIVSRKKKTDVFVEEIAQVVQINTQQHIPERSAEHVDDMAVPLNLGEHRAAKNRRASGGNRRGGAGLHATALTERVQKQTVDNIVDGPVPQAAHHAAERV